ncbi:MAG: phosphoribosylanthranilate isomerase [Candidatus Kapabacteria bacterium]|nr:phosphoribosylanthranilate isomerase [Candidatus Kapabacteria bacterium]
MKTSRFLMTMMMTSSHSVQQQSLSSSAILQATDFQPVISPQTHDEHRRSPRVLRVKVCGLREEANINALLTSSFLPDALGFIFYPKSPRYVGESLRPDFMRFLRQYVCTVGVFVNASPDTILQSIENFGFSAVQLHGAETVDFCTNLKERIKLMFPALQIWKAFSIATAEDLRAIAQYEGIIDKALLDTKGAAHGGNGTRFDWSLLKEYSSHIPFFLSGGIALEHAAEIKKIQHPYLYGVDINSRFETAPALKDVATVHGFLESLAHNP